tara:strand:- start:353 stop:607 length:255 start_codon:yes stop_codon:yes gene_type:complete
LGRCNRFVKTFIPVTIISNQINKQGEKIMIFDLEKQIQYFDNKYPAMNTAEIYENVDNTFIAEDEENAFYSESYAELLSGWIIG